jgi:hypothetical protein
MPFYRILAVVVLLSLGWGVEPLHAGEDSAKEGTIFTLWPLIDYRDSPAEKYRNLSILGPLLKFQKRGDDHVTAFRPLFYRSSNPVLETTETTYLYPLASERTTPDASWFQGLLILQSNTFRRDETGKEDNSSMLFPFLISGTSAKYGKYMSVFPFYGDIYERFWRDEYHYVLFPLYGRTVNKGTTTRNYLYPFFSTISGDKESGFNFWPLYGSSEKEGVYSKTFALWPVYMREKKGLDSDNPTDKLTIFPFYSATDSPKIVSRGYLWPFFGYTVDKEHQEEETDYFWPFIWTVRGERRNAESFLPLYSREKKGENLKRWYLWPLLKHEEMNSSIYTQQRDRLLYFLYTDLQEQWPKDGMERRRSALWPLFLYKRDTRGGKSLSMPAPVESIFDKEGIEKNWAPFWRIYQHMWHESGDSTMSIFWNLYWHELRGDDTAWELFPLLAYRSEKKHDDLQLLKGLIRYRNRDGEKSIALLWLPFGINWGKENIPPAAVKAEPRGAE